MRPAPRPIVEIAARLGIADQEVEPYGRFKAKVALSVLDRPATRPHARYVVVTSMTPTPRGEGKTVTTLGLAMGLRHLGDRAVAAIRQPSLGPVFGRKGGGAGGGQASVVPLEEANLHLTGDFHAVALGHNLLAAMVDNSLAHGNPLGLDPRSITWPRVVDVNDRALRRIVIGLGGREGGVPRETGFEIAAASEVMAILALASDLGDLRRRLGRIVVGFTASGRPVTAEDLRAAGAMAVVMRDTVKPNLLQTTDGTPVLLHAGPFANIAHGNSSILADRVALALADWVVTESGFGAELGLEKFADIKCRASGLAPDVVVLVSTLRALKLHGWENLAKQIENAREFGVPVVVAVNAFETDTEADIAAVRQRALDAGAEGAWRSDAWARGAAGAEALAAAVRQAAARPRRFHFLYELDRPIPEKIELIATRLYGAEGVDYAPAARRAIDRVTALGWGALPVCMAKTQLSLSHDPALAGRPRGFRVPVRDVRVAAGAGFVLVLLGEMLTMPGLPAEPNAWKIDLDEQGDVVGLA